VNVPKSTPPLRVLIVCTANICRSAYAEQLGRHLLREAASELRVSEDVVLPGTPDGNPPVEPPVVFESAGTHGWTDHPVEAEMAAQLTRRGVPPDGFASRPLTMGMVDAADLVLTADRSHRQFVLDDRPAAVWRTFTLAQFARTISELPDGLTGRELIAACRRVHRPATADDEVADPYRRGPEAAAEAADQIERLLREIVPRLLPR
jgi:protein-tyrosine-phosphatase